MAANKSALRTMECIVAMEPAIASAVERTTDGRPLKTIILENIPGFVEKYRQTGRTPDLHFRSDATLHLITLPTPDRYHLRVSSGLEHLLHPGRNTFNPPLRLEAGDWLRFDPVIPAEHPPARAPQEVAVVPSFTFGVRADRRRRWTVGMWW